jgi:AraC family transcriptional activator FtrA
MVLGGAKSAIGGNANLRQYSAMPSPRIHGPKNRLVVALAYDGLCTFEFGVAVEVFGLKRSEFDFPWYRFAVAALERGPLRATGGVAVRPAHGLEILAKAGTIVIPGWRAGSAKPGDERPPEPVLAVLRRAHARGARILTICSGVYVLAATGLLDGRRATTHWRYTADLQRRYPRIEVDPDVLYVDEGTLLTSAGSAAGIDLCLHLVRRDYGARVANAVAKRLVAPPHRDGGQSQYIAPPRRGDADTRLGRLLDWASGRLDEALPVARLAREARMSLRTFERRFRQETGATPNDWLAHQRVARAQEMLESTDRPIEWISAACGFGAPETLRHHFRRILRTTPSAYRRAFARAG